MSWQDRIKRLWQVPEGGKVADKPHLLTLLVGLLGPVTAILAITFTFMGYRLSSESLRMSQAALATSQQSLQVGQRAYLSIQKTEMDMLDTTGDGLSTGPNGERLLDTISLTF